MRIEIIIALLAAVVLLTACRSSSDAPEQLWEIEHPAQTSMPQGKSPEAKALPAEKVENPDTEKIVTESFCRKLIDDRVLQNLKREVIKPIGGFEGDSFGNVEIEVKHTSPPPPLASRVPATSTCSYYAVGKWYPDCNNFAMPKDVPQKFRDCVFTPITISFQCDYGKLGISAKDYVSGQIMMNGKAIESVGDSAVLSRRRNSASIAISGCVVMPTIYQERDWDEGQTQSAEKALLGVASLIGNNFP